MGRTLPCRVISPRHGKVVADRNLGQRRNQRGGQGDTGGGAILGYSAFGGMDMDIVFLNLSGAMW